ncbi:glycosyltransferase family 4 protein (plasmid) [Nonomuraea sp. NBC_00507]|uniref:glycosyltransferase family 4 protein n=1 Tax=Nonomuraea sp. NBC_00507 TaxID=2976002 RepID=UPI002E19AB69
MPRTPLTVDTAVQFFPRGGSAFVVKYLNQHLMARGVRTNVICGSLGKPGQASHAATFYQGLPIAPYDYNSAAAAHASGLSSMDGQRAPFHPSFEDRGPAAPDTQATAVAPATFIHLINVWHRHLARHRSASPDIVHLHHLSHLQQAALYAYPNTPRVTTLHGTDLNLLHQAHAIRALAERAGTDPDHLADTLPPAPDERAAVLSALAHEHGFGDDDAHHLTATDWRLWRHTTSWITSMQRWARHAGHLVTVSAGDRAEARHLLGVDEEHITVIGNGADLTRFIPRDLTTAERFAHLRRWLVEDPRGWAPGQQPGTIRYSDHDLERLRDHHGHLRPMVLWIGRYQKVKRLSLLMEAFAAAMREVNPAPALLLWGGAPGECEGEHPLRTAQRLGIDKNVYVIGWRGHDELPLGLACADLMAAPAVGESFGMVYVEAMACGVPPIATHTGGPADFIVSSGPQANGWTVRPDDPHHLASALQEALINPGERARRGRNAAALAHSTYGWPTVVNRYQALYERLRRSASSA